MQKKSVRPLLFNHLTYILMNAIKVFMEKIIRKDTAESSKRLVALFVMSVIIYLIIRYTDESNFESILNSLLIFESTLLGISSIESVTMYQKKQNGHTPPDKKEEV